MGLEVHICKEECKIAILSQRDADKIKQALDGLAAPVRLFFFTGEDCETCDDSRALFTEVAALSSNLKLEEHVIGSAVASQFSVDKVPAVILTGEDGKDTGIRFYGIPAGYEFATFLEDLSDVAGGKTRLSEETRAALAGITKPVRIQVFVTPT
ncbi:MAG: hypothetical protein ACYC5Y_08350 [Symbiobacteriia bacterium]